jgi:glucose-1-phosphate thymidylyltransferase
MLFQLQVLMQDIEIGLVPAAGKGLRLNLPYPKELYPVIRHNRYKPVAQFVLDSLVLASVNHIVFVVNETKHQLIGYFGDGHRFGSRLSYVVQEPNGHENGSRSPGLADALESAFHLARGKTVFFGMPDTIIEPRDVFARLRTGAHPEDDVVLALFPTGNPEKFGMVHLAPDDCVIEVVDKPPSTDLTYMWGCIMWRPRFTEHLHECVTRCGMGDFAAILNSAIQAGLSMRGVRFAEGSYRDLGTYDEITAIDDQARQH